MAIDEQGDGDRQPDWIRLNPNRMCTRALYRLIFECHEAVTFFLFVIHLATSADKARMATSEVLAIISTSSSEDVARYEAALANPTPAFDELRKFGIMQSQNLVIRASNAFLVYYSEIIQNAIIKRPEILKSKQTIRWDELLGFNRFDELVRYMIDKKINELSYAGLSQMEDFMFDRLGIENIITERQRNLAAILVEIRNIYTHNRGVLNSIFISRIRDSSDFLFQEGKYFHTDFDDFMRLSGNCLEVAYAIDGAVAKKFGLKRKRYAVWRKASLQSEKDANNPTNSDAPFASTQSIIAG